MPAVLSDTTCMLCILTTAHSQQGFVGKCRAVFLGSKAGWNHSANATEGIMETSKVQQHPPAMYKHEVAYFLKISEGAGRKAADRDEACMKDDQRSPKPAEKKRWRPAETGISWDTQKNWQREACTSVSELNRLWRKTSNYTKSANIPDIHRFNIWPEQSLQSLWMDGGKRQMLLPAGQTIQVPVPFHAHPSILNVWPDITQGKSLYLSEVCLHPWEVWFLFFLLMETAERQARWHHELPGADCTERLSPST